MLWEGSEVMCEGVWFGFVVGVGVNVGLWEISVRGGLV